MERDLFTQRKKSVLSKLDKSSVGKWDNKIKGLCDKINEDENFYTTSSCSGRIVLMFDQDKKGEGLFLKVWHDKIILDELKDELNKIRNNKNLVKFKLEPPILHVSCRNLDFASSLLEKAKYFGFKRSGILSLGKNIILELNSTEKLEFPIIKDSKLLVGFDFLGLIVETSNHKLEKGWKKIDKLMDYFKNNKNL